MSKITESARDEECQIRLVGICNRDPATTVWCHANGSAAGKGIGMKAHDLLGAYGCSACHDAYDRRQFMSATPNYSREQVELSFWKGHARSLLLLIEKGIVVMQRGKAVIKDGVDIDAVHYKLGAVRRA